MKKFVAGAAVALTLASTAAAGFGAFNTTAEAAKAKKTLTVGFVPSSQADKIEALAKPLEKLLSKELDRPVKVTVSTDYNSIVEALGSDQLDIGFLPPTAYVEAHKQYGAKVLLQTTRYGVNKEDGTPTDKLVGWYKSEIIVRKDSGINSIDDLKGKTIAVQDTTSSAGYQFPMYYLESKGFDATKDSKLITVKGHDQGALAVENKQADAAFIFQDARNIVKKDTPTIFKDTKIIALTQKIPNDTVTARKGLSKKLQSQVQNALIKIAKTKKGHDIVYSIYSVEGFTKSKNSNFAIVREVAKKVSGE